jgi:hypothetical protein
LYFQGYLEYWQQTPEECVKLEELHELFSNIHEIHTFSRDFLLELERCGLDPVGVARCFVWNNEGFSIYTQYCTNYPR